MQARLLGALALATMLTSLHTIEQPATGRDPATVISVTRGRNDNVVVSVKNIAGRPLTALGIRVTVVRAGAPPEVNEQTVDFFRGAAIQASTLTASTTGASLKASIPIEGIEVFQVLTAPGWSSAEAAVTAAIFADGTTSGETAAGLGILQRRVRVADAVDRWLPALQRVHDSVPPGQRAEELRAELSNRTAALKHPMADDDVPGLVRSVLRRADHDSSQLTPALEEVIDYLTRLRQEARRHVR